MRAAAGFLSQAFMLCALSDSTGETFFWREMRISFGCVCLIKNVRYFVDATVVASADASLASTAANASSAW